MKCTIVKKNLKNKIPDIGQVFSLPGCDDILVRIEDKYGVVLYPSYPPHCSIYAFSLKSLKPIVLNKENYQFILLEQTADAEFEEV